MSYACPWCHRFAGGEAERCLFPGSQQCYSERRKEDEAHAINAQKRGVSAGGTCEWAGEL